MVLKRVGVLSAAKVSGALMALLGLILGGMMALVSAAGIAINAQQNGPQFLAIFLGISAVIIVPIFYGVFGFIIGAIYAALYKLIAIMVGGLELEFEGNVTYSSSPG